MQAGASLPIGICYDARRLSVRYDYDYGADDPLLRLTGSDGHGVQLAYDDAGRATGLIDDAGNRLAVDLDRRRAGWGHLV